MSEVTVQPTTPLADPVAPEVQRMRDALDRGDHQQARAIAATLRVSDDPALKAEAETMAMRFRRDPWVDAVFVGSAMLMLFLAVHYLGHR